MARNIFLKIPGITGNASEKTHLNEVVIEDWAWTMQQDGSMQEAHGGGAGLASVSDLSFSKKLDRASPSMMGDLLKGTHYDKVIMSVQMAGGTSAIDYYLITLEECMLTDFHTIQDASEKSILESWSLNFRKLTVSFQPQSKSGGKDGGAVTANWDVATNATF